MSIEEELEVLKAKPVEKQAKQPIKLVEYKYGYIYIIVAVMLLLFGFIFSSTILVLCLIPDLFILFAYILRRRYYIGKLLQYNACINNARKKIYERNKERTNGNQPVSSPFEPTVENTVDLKTECQCVETVSWYFDKKIKEKNMIRE